MSKTPRAVDVAVGVIHDSDGRVLVNQRAKDKTFAGRWEFPGGKIEAGEAVEQALARELSEELDIRIDRQRPLLSFTHHYETLTVRLHVNEVLVYRGIPTGREGQAVRWVETNSLRQIDLLDANTSIVTAILLPRICVITDTGRFGERQTLELLERHVKRQPVLVVVREKAMEGRRLESFVRRVMEICRGADSLVCVHADCSFSEYEDVDGIHLPARHPGASRVPESAGLVGISCHSKKELLSAQRLGVDYAFLSPVKETGSHPTANPLGWRGFAQLCAPAPMPVFALGGMEPTDFETAIEQGAQGIAMLGAAWRSDSSQ